MFEWLKKKTPPPVVPPPPPDETKRPGIGKYNPALIASLMREHRQLLGVYHEMLAALDSEEFADVGKLLQAFRDGLKAHLLKEHVELYIYLEYTLAKNPESFKQMHELRVEMDHISVEVMGFVNTYQNTPMNAASAARFRKDLEEVGAVLVARIGREEKSLYSLYRAA